MIRGYLAVVMIILSVMLSGCGRELHEVSESVGISRKGTDSPVIEKEVAKQGASGQDSPAELVIELCQDFYKEEGIFDASKNLARTQKVVQVLGGHGYVAVDSDNQVDLAGREQVKRFCTSVDRKEEDQLTVIVVAVPNGFTEYILHTRNGQIKVSKEYYQYNNGCFNKKIKVDYCVDLWQYTEEGYLIFTGDSYFEESYVLTMSQVPQVVAWRVEPLEEHCRELNRQYILPVGYRRNNIFLCDWNEEDYGKLDFYDIFDLFYQDVYKRPVPYVADKDVSVGSVYQIPEAEFEQVVQMHFGIECKSLHSKAKYMPQSGTYEYRPRGLYEVEYTSQPYPEVVDYHNNSDKTVTLTVNAVYPEEGTSRAYTHEVIVRPLDNGGFFYVSNRRIPSEDDYGTGWHTDRLTQEEWKEIYGEGDR